MKPFQPVKGVYVPIDMTPEQRQEIIRRLQKGEDLPEEWRWTLFPPDKQECDLVYGGKQREEDILAHTMAVPLQNVRSFNNGNGRPTPGQWYNRLIFGDNLQAMKSLLDDPDVRGKVKLVYIDPPFATKQDFRGSQDQKAYQDKIAGAEFIEFIRKRLILLKQLLAPNGSIYIHLDSRKGHYIKCILDELFGESCFQNEIIWKRSAAHSDASTFATIHDTIYFYSRNPDFFFSPRYQPYTEDYIDERYKHTDPDGRRFVDDNLTATGLKGGGYEYDWKGFKKIWRCPLSTMERYERENKLYTTKSGAPRLKRYLDEMPGLLMQDIWLNIFPVNSQAAERVGYPTQKPETLLEVLINASSEPGDIVLDAFAGSGTTCAVAEKLGRRWIGMDCGKLAQYTIQKRMLNLREGIGNKGKALTAKPFLVQNAGLYDFDSLRDLPWEDWRFFALQLFECKDHPHKIGGLEIDGEKAGAPVLVFDWKKNPNEKVSEETIADIHGMVGKKIGRKFYIIAPMMAFDFFQDYVDCGNVRYYALRIPYTMIQELHKRDFKSVLQARDEGNVNDIQEAYGFSFMIAPEVEWKAKVEKQKDDLFSYAVLETKKFVSKARIKGTEREGGMETLALLMVDLNYDGKVFDLDAALYGEDLEKSKWSVRFAPEEVGEKVMAVWVDYHGNEAKVVIGREDFGLPKIKNPPPQEKPTARKAKPPVKNKANNKRSK